MRGFFLFSVLMLSISSCSAASSSPKQSPSPSPTPEAVGPLTRTDLEAKGFTWLTDGVAAEKKRLAEDPSAPARLRLLSEKLGGVDIEVYMASWCGDTKRQLPIFLTTMDASGARPKSLQLFGLDRKRTYPGYTNPRKIKAIPTIVFFRRDKEIGRFVETPTKSVLEDVLEILQQQDPQ